MQNIKVLSMKKYYKNSVYSLFFVCMVGFLLPTIAEATSEDSISSWQYQRVIEIESGLDGEFVYVPLTVESDIARNSFRDLRVFDGESMIPYQFIVEDEENTTVLQQATVMDLSRGGDGEMMFIVELSEDGGLHNSLNLSFPAGEFRRNVSVYASDTKLSHESDQWRQLTDDAYTFSFFDSRTGTRLSDSQIRYPESSARFLRVVIERGEGQVGDVNQVQVRREISREADSVEIERNVDVSHSLSENTTEIVIDMGRHYIPVRSIELSLSNPDEIFHRDAVVQQSSDALRWRTVSRDSVFNIKTDRFFGQRLTLSIPETESRYFRVVVFNQDDSPVQFDDHVALTTVLRAIVFEVRHDKDYVLLYGNTAARAPQYDLSRYFQYLDLEDMPQAQLSTSSENPEYRVEEEKVPFTEEYRVALNLFLIVMVLVMAGVAVITIRRGRLGDSHKIEDDHISKL